MKPNTIIMDKPCGKLVCNFKNAVTVLCSVFVLSCDLLKSEFQLVLKCSRMSFFVGVLIETGGKK